MAGRAFGEYWNARCLCVVANQGEGDYVSLEVHGGGHEWSGIEALPVLQQELAMSM